MIIKERARLKLDKARKSPPVRLHSLFSKLFQEQAERLLLLDEDIAAEEEGLRFEAQMEGHSWFLLLRYFLSYLIF